MGFAVGMEEEKLQEKAIRGMPHKVAADCWFTSTGKMIPRMIKYEDADGVRHLLKEIEVIKSDIDKNIVASQAQNELNLQNFYKKD